MKQSFDYLKKKIIGLDKKKDAIKVMSDTYGRNKEVSKILDGCERDISGETEGLGDEANREDAVIGNR